MIHSRRTFLIASAATAANAQVQPKPDIFQAATNGDMPRATELVTANPEIVRARSADGRTPLHFATAAGKPEMVTFLMSKGAELSAGPESPLLAAVDHPNAEIAFAMVQPILGNASDPNAKRRDGKTALRLAAGRGHQNVVEFLIHRGAAISTADVEAATGEAVATLKNADAIERVHFDRRYIQDIHGKPVDRDDLNGLPWTLVNQFATVSHFDFEKVKQLHQVNPGLLSTRASWDELGIEAAAHTGHFDMADWFAQKGSPVSTCTAALLGLQDIVKKALAADRLSLNERGAHDLPLLAYTAYAKEQPGIAEMLLNAGAKVDVRAFGLTTLHLAATKGHVALAEVLVAKGADVNLAVKSRGDMVTPLGLAVKAKQEKMEQFLKDRGGKV